MRGCKKHKALHCVFPAGNAVVAACCVQRLQRATRNDLGRPQTLRTSEVKEFGPLIVSIDTCGRNLFDENKVVFNQRKEEACQEIIPEVSFIK